MTSRPDEALFVSMMQAHENAVYNLCYRMLGNASEAEDATQETFLRAYDHLSRYDQARSPKTWLLAIAHHHCIDRLRRRRVTCLDLDDEALAESLPGRREDDDPERLAVQNEGHRHVQALLGRLQPEDRALVVMRYWYDLSYVEMAETTGSTVGAVKSRLHRARGALAGMLAGSRPANSQPRRARPAADSMPAAAGLRGLAFAR